MCIHAHFELIDGRARCPHRAWISFVSHVLLERVSRA
jgi:hypothetical protein